MDGMTLGYRENTGHNYVFVFVLKKIGSKIAGISDEEIIKLTKKAVNKIQSKLQTQG